jgi:pimeloyl-ACP methyl ester carboxylesterase
MAWVLWFYSTPLGQWIYRTFNVSAGVLLPYGWGQHKPLTPELHAAYQAPLATTDDRRGTAAFPGELIGDTLAALEDKAPTLAQWPVRAVWGMADRLVGPSELARWRDLLPAMESEELPDVGHFVAEEAPEAVAKAVRALSTKR